MRASYERRAVCLKERLAELAGLDRNYIAQIERAERNPAVVNVVKIANALKVPPAELFRSFGR